MSLSRFLLAALLLSLPLVAYLLYMNASALHIPGFQEPLPTLLFNQKTPLRVTVVERPRDLGRGLSGRSSLAPTEGMLFVFPENDYHGIWMKEMNFPIDILWVSETGVIVDGAEGVRPDTFPRVFEPRVPARFVIETNAHFLDSFDIRVGDTVTLPESVLPDDLKKK